MRKALALVLLGLLLVSSTASAGILEDFLGWLGATGEAISGNRVDGVRIEVGLNVTNPKDLPKAGTTVDCSFFAARDGVTLQSLGGTTAKLAPGRGLYNGVCTFNTTSADLLDLARRGPIYLSLSTSNGTTIFTARPVLKANEDSKNIFWEKGKNIVRRKARASFQFPSPEVCCRLENPRQYLVTASIKCQATIGTIVGDASSPFCTNPGYCESPKDCAYYNLYHAQCVGDWTCAGTGKQCNWQCEQPTPPPMPQEKKVFSVGRGPADSIPYLEYDDPQGAHHKIPAYIPNLSFAKPGAGRVFTLEGANPYYYEADPDTLTIKIIEGTSPTGTNVVAERTIPPGGSWDEQVTLKGLNDVGVSFIPVMTSKKGFVLVLAAQVFKLSDGTQVIFNGWTNMEPDNGFYDPAKDTFNLDDQLGIGGYVIDSTEFPLNPGFDESDDQEVINEFTHVIGKNHFVNIFIDGANGRLRSWDSTPCEALYYAYNTSVCVVSAFSDNYFNSVTTPGSNRKYTYTTDGSLFKATGQG